LESLRGNVPYRLKFQDGSCRRLLRAEARGSVWPDKRKMKRPVAVEGSCVAAISL